MPLCKPLKAVLMKVLDISLNLKAALCAGVTEEDGVLIDCYIESSFRNESGLFEYDCFFFQSICLYLSLITNTSVFLLTV